MILDFGSRAARGLPQPFPMFLFSLSLFFESSGAVGARMNNIQQVQCVNFQKILNMWFVFQNPENIMKAIKYPYCRQPERALPLWVHEFGFSCVSFSSQLHSRRARLGLTLPRPMLCDGAVWGQEQQLCCPHQNLLCMGWRQAAEPISIVPHAAGRLIQGCCANFPTVLLSAQVPC